MIMYDNGENSHMNRGRVKKVNIISKDIYF